MEAYPCHPYRPKHHPGPERSNRTELSGRTTSRHVLLRFQFDTSISRSMLCIRECRRFVHATCRIHLSQSETAQPFGLLRSHIQSIPTQTGVIDSIDILTRRLLERTAKSLGATHLLLGRNMSSLSMALLSNICSGRGASISDETVASWDGLLSFNPLRDLGSKECATYLYWNNIRVISSAIRRADSNGNNASISQLTGGAPCSSTTCSLTPTSVYHWPGERLSIDCLNYHEDMCQSRPKG